MIDQFPVDVASVNDALRSWAKLNEALNKQNGSLNVKEIKLALELELKQKNRPDVLKRLLASYHRGVSELEHISLNHHLNEYQDKLRASIKDTTDNYVSSDHFKG